MLFFKYLTKTTSSFKIINLYYKIRLMIEIRKIVQTTDIIRLIEECAKFETMIYRLRTHDNTSEFSLRVNDEFTLAAIYKDSDINSAISISAKVVTHNLSIDMVYNVELDRTEVTVLSPNSNGVNFFYNKNMIDSNFVGIMDSISQIIRRYIFLYLKNDMAKYLDIMRGE